MNFKLGAVACLALAIALPCVAPAAAEPPFPSHPIRIIVPTAPGGGTDVAIRLLASIAEKTLGQNLLVVDRPGADGTIGVQAMLDAPADGYTLAGVWNSPITIGPQIVHVAYQPSSYVPLVMSDVSPVVYCTMSSFPANTGEAFIAELKAHPGKYTYGTDGAAGNVRLTAELVFSSLGVHARAVPFGGAGETLVAFLSHSVDIYGGSIQAILPFVQNGQAKCLMVSTQDRSNVVPGAAGLKELGVPQDATVLWHGVIAPAGVPADRLAVLQRAFEDAAHSERYRAFAQKQGQDAVAWGPDQARAAITTEYAAFGRIISQLGMGAGEAK
jgi:tripartite-type tricarboxylate transporter receptor subunit TctC